MIENYEQEIRNNGKSESTIEAYIRDIKQFKGWISETLGQESNVITPTDIREYRQYLNLNKRMNVTSINRKIKSIVLFQRYLCNQGICKEEVKLKSVLQKNSIELDSEVKVIDKQEQYRLKRTIEAKGNKRDTLIYYLLFGTGVRCSELISIEIDDIYLTERNGKNNYSYVLIRRGKGNKSRKINLNADVVNAIKEYLIVRPQTKSLKLLHGQRGELTRSAINKILEKYCKMAQIDVGVSPHVARHTFCTTLIKNNIDAKTVALLAGDSSVDIIYKFYVNSSIQDRQNAVDKLNI